MDIRSIQRSDEKIVFTIAMFFSCVCWCALLLSFFSPPQPKEFCIYDDDDEYYHVSMEEAIENEYTDYCLAREDVPDNVWEETEKSFLATARENWWAARFVIGFYAGILIAFVYVPMGLAMAYIRMNGVKLSMTQQKDLYRIYARAGEKLNMDTLPSAYVIDGDGIANAFAVKIARKRMVVFYAELVERMLSEQKEDELLAIAGHELTHVKLHHISYWLLLLPFSFVPFAQHYLSRLRELSADQGAYFVTGNVETVTKALMKIVLGVRTTRDASVQEYVEESMKERGVFAGLTRMLATHPSIPERIAAVQNLTKKLSNA